MKSRTFLLVSIIVTTAWADASAQNGGVGPGKLEIGGFAGGESFSSGGDDNTEVNFGVYTFGGGLTWYTNSKVTFEAEAACSARHRSAF